MLPNLESRWDAPPLHAVDLRLEVERRIGPTNESLHLLAGGLANVTVRIGSHQVLRIFTRDPEQARKERCLLERGWVALRVPAILDGGDDYLLMEYVPHRALDGTANCGEAVGRALAEIHVVQYGRSGFVNAELEVTEPFEDFLTALIVHVEERFDHLGDRWAALRSPVRAALEGLRQFPEVTTSAVLLHGDFKVSNLHWAERPLVLDWEFAYAGPPLMDVGQLLRWSPPRPFIDGFSQGYTAGDGRLENDWVAQAAVLDLGNLVGLAAGRPTDRQRSVDIHRRIEETLREDLT